MTFKPDPKPAARKRKRIRIVDARAIANAKVARPRCEMCGAGPVTTHHVVPKGAPHFGDDVLANLVSLCGHGTSGCHGDIEHKRSSATAQLGLHLTRRRPDVIEYVEAKLGGVAGPDWFRRTFGVTL